MCMFLEKSPTSKVVSKKHQLRYTSWLVTMMSCILFSSCFQVVEDITVRKDGSGTAVLMANFSASRSKLASMMLLDSVQGHKVPSRQDIQREMATIVAALKQVEGISQVSHTLDFDRFIVRVNFSFSDVSKLNGVTEMVFRQFKITTQNTSSYSLTKAGRFSRQYSYNPDAGKAFARLTPEDRQVLDGAMYTSIYRFDRAVEHVSHPLAKKASAGQSVMLQAPIIDLITGKTNVSNQIQLK